MREEENGAENFFATYLHFYDAPGGGAVKLFFVASLKRRENKLERSFPTNTFQPSLIFADLKFITLGWCTKTCSTEVGSFHSCLYLKC